MLVVEVVGSRVGWGSGASMVGVTGTSKGWGLETDRAELLGPVRTVNWDQ